MRSDTLLSLCFGVAVSGLAGLAVSCGPNDSNIVVNVTTVPMRAVKLSVSATLEGRPAKNMVDLATPLDRFGFTLPGGMSGHLLLNATAFDSDGCEQGSGQSAANLPNPLVNIALPMSAQSPRQCGMLPGCATSTVCTFTPVPQMQNIRGLWAISTSDIWGVGNAGTIIHYDGNSWSTTPSGVTSDLWGVWASGSNDVWAVGDLAAAGGNAVVLHTTGGGAPWTAVNNPGIPNKLNSIFGIGTADLWVVGDSAVGGAPDFWHRDFQNTWKKLPIAGMTGYLSGVWASSPTDIYASGATGVVLHSNGTTTTSAQAAGALQHLLSIWGNAPNSIFAVGVMGTSVKYDGSSWKSIPNGTTQDLRYVFGDGTLVYVTGASGTFLVSSPALDSFSAYTTKTSNILYAMQPGGSGIGWVVGAGGYLGYFDIRP
jgi:hypothetical protein